MFVAILNDGTCNGDALLLDWTHIPVSDEEVATITLSELVDRRHDAFVADDPELEEDVWDEIFAHENDYVKRAFIIDKELISTITEATSHAELEDDSDAYAANSVIICIMEALSTRVVK